MNATIIGHVDLKPPSKPQVRPQVPKQERKGHRQQAPQDARSTNLAQLAELQFCKAQIKSLRNNLIGFDDLRAAAAAFLGNQNSATLQFLKDAFNSL
jgi:hypothetical protein